MIVGLEREDDPTNDQWDFRRVTAVETDMDAGRTKITFDRPLGSAFPPNSPPEQVPKVYALRLRAALFGHNAPAWNTLPVALRVGEINPNPLRPPSFPGLRRHGRRMGGSATSPNATTIHLDAPYPQVAVGSWIVLDKPK